MWPKIEITSHTAEDDFIVKRNMYRNCAYFFKVLNTTRKRSFIFSLYYLANIDHGLLLPYIAIRNFPSSYSGEVITAKKSKILHFVNV